MNKQERKFVEIHMLQNYAPSNLNRDDTGSVKDCTFGGYPRARISSQAIKRSIRDANAFQENLKEYLGERTKFLPEEIKKYLIDEKKISETDASMWAEKFMTIGKSDKKNDKDSEEKKKKKENIKEETILATAQLMFYGKDELKKIVDWIIKKNGVIPDKIEPKEIQNALKDLKAKPVDIALFGRMTTLEAFEDVNATCQVAHAISVNQFSTEFDYFTAVDDLSKEYRDDSGSAHIGETEFTSACFYKYFAIDYDEFVKTIGNDENLAKTAMKAFIQAISLSNPSGKQNSFAAHNPPHFIGIEIKNKKIPVNLANAFIQPIKPSHEKSLNDNAAEALAEYAIKNRKAFALPVAHAGVFLLNGKDEAGKNFTADEKSKFEDLNTLTDWLLSKI
ncbi:MAG: type I-E CRISPR-associated protein Cas7/Cse4/CasC [Spirochaetia bacterium]|nr:type I-E CRISPR-associated protein Cas7/Cse4/CasC [Spirochaetia bacterium]